MTFGADVVVGHPYARDAPEAGVSRGLEGAIRKLGWPGALALMVAVGLGVSACDRGGSSTPSSPTPAATTPTVPSPPAPTVTGISPSSGLTAGGTAVTITGTNFTEGASVTIAGVAATAVTVESATNIKAKTGAGTAGPGDVVVTVGGQTGRLPGGFTYQAPTNVLLSFTVYNHTVGPMGTFSQTALSGNDVTLRIGSLGVLPGAAGAQTAVNVSGVDPNRIVVRQAAQGGRIGGFVAFSDAGQVAFKAPYAAGAYDVFLMNNTPACVTADGSRSGSFYHEIDKQWGGLDFVPGSEWAEKGECIGNQTTVGPAGRTSQSTLPSGCSTLCWQCLGCVTAVSYE